MGHWSDPVWAQLSPRLSPSTILFPCLICCSAFCSLTYLLLHSLLPPLSVMRHLQKLSMQLVAHVVQVGHPCSSRSALAFFPVLPEGQQRIRQKAECKTASHAEEGDYSGIQAAAGLNLWHAFPNVWLPPVQALLIVSLNLLQFIPFNPACNIRKQSWIHKKKKKSKCLTNLFFKKDCLKADLGLYAVFQPQTRHTRETH